MTAPPQMPVEEARKKFADLLNGTQFRGQHTEITRHGNAAGVLVPPDWYAAATQALNDVDVLRRQIAEMQRATPKPPAERPATPAAAPRPAPRKAAPAVPMAEARAQQLADLAVSRANPQQLEALQQITGGVREDLKAFAIASHAVDYGLLTREEFNTADS